MARVLLADSQPLQRSLELTSGGLGLDNLTDRKKEPGL